MGFFYKITKLLGLSAWASRSTRAVPSASYPCLWRFFDRSYYNALEDNVFIYYFINQTVANQFNSYVLIFLR